MEYIRIVERTIHRISTANAPTPAGHYSQAVIHEQTVYVSGLLPVDPGTGAKVHGPIGQQTERVLLNLAAILAASGSGLDRVLKVTIYVADIGLWGDVNVAYARVFGEHRPARTVVPVKELHHGFLIELDAIAAL